MSDQGRYAHRSGFCGGQGRFPGDLPCQVSWKSKSPAGLFTPTNVGYVLPMTINSKNTPIDMYVNKPATATCGHIPVKGSNTLSSGGELKSSFVP